MVNFNDDDSFFSVDWLVNCCVCHFWRTVYFEDHWLPFLCFYPLWGKGGGAARILYSKSIFISSLSF